MKGSVNLPIDDIYCLKTLIALAKRQQGRGGKSENPRCKTLFLTDPNCQLNRIFPGFNGLCIAYERNSFVL